jgi:hypothetical protein
VILQLCTLRNERIWTGHYVGSFPVE